MSMLVALFCFVVAGFSTIVFIDTVDPIAGGIAIFLVLLGLWWIADSIISELHSAKK